VQWRFAVSSTLRGIYAIRYLLFSGGMAILGALIQRAFSGAERTAFGLLVGLAVGLVVFRGQLRPLRWPTLLLSQEAIYLIRGKTAAIIPWASVEEIAVSEGAVVLRVLPASKSAPVEQIRLKARQYGTSADALEKTLRPLAAGRQLRSALPTEEQLRRAGAIPPSRGVSHAPSPPTDLG
jgi:hypothetical protein